jgi:hypothetical protein
MFSSSSFIEFTILYILCASKSQSWLITFGSPKPRLLFKYDLFGFLSDLCGFESTTPLEPKVNKLRVTEAIESSILLTNV